jgi:hypothetical protein
MEQILQLPCVCRVFDCVNGRILVNGLNHRSKSSLIFEKGRIFRVLGRQPYLSEPGKRDLLRVDEMNRLLRDAVKPSDPPEFDMVASNFPLYWGEA